MFNHSHQQSVRQDGLLFEVLEKRDLFSVASPALQSVLSAAHRGVPASIVAARTPVVRAVQNAGTGLTGEYFLDNAFQQAYMVRPDSTVNLAGQKSDPATTQSQGVRWTGTIASAFSEPYTFSVASNGGVRLWVNGQQIINLPESRGGIVQATSQIVFTAGQACSIELEFIRNSPAAMKVSLRWASEHQKLAVVSRQALFPDTTVALPATTAGLIGSYYLGKNFDQLVMQRIDPRIDFNFGHGSPTPMIPEGASFSVRWTGQIVPAYSETYTFKTTTDDGVRLYVDDQLVINDFTIHSAKSDTALIPLVAGQAYDIRMDYFENSGVASAFLRWSSPSQQMQIIPASAYTSTPAASAGTLTAGVSTTIADAVDLSWTGSPTATGYIIQQSTDGGINYTNIASTAAGVLTYQVRGLDPNTDYSFRIVPKGSADTSIPTDWTPATTLTPSPIGTSATPISDHSVKLAWDDVTGETGFIVYDSTDGGRSFAPIATLAQGVTDFTASGLTPGTDYLFSVSALNSDGVPSNPGNDAETFTTTAPPDLSGDPVVTSSSVILNWADSAGETGFSVERSLDDTNWTQIGTTGQGVTTYTDTAVLPGTPYFYRIRSLNSAGQSDPSLDIDAVTATVSPGGVTSTATTATGTLLNWADVAGESGFLVLESIDGGNTFSQLGITPAGVTNFTVTGLVSGSNYQFAVEALNASGMPSLRGSPASVLTLPAAPASLLTSSISTTAATLSWMPVTGGTGFMLQRSPTGTGAWTTLATLASTTLTYTDTTLASGTNYFYRINATNAAGSSAPSSSATALTIPAVPIASLAGLSTAQSQVSWNAVTGASQYVVQRSLDGATNWTTVATPVGTATSAIVSNITASTMFYYRVQAVNATGNSAQSAVVGQVTAPLAQYAVRNVVYGTTSTGQIYAVNLTGGTSNLIGKLPVIPQGAVRDPVSGVMYFYQQGTSNIYLWDPATGNTTEVDTSFIPSPTASGAYLPDGTSYIVGTNGTLYKGASNTLSVTTVGNLTVAGMAFTGSPSSMTFSPGGVLYMTVGANLYTVNTTTAVVTPIASTVLGNILAVFGPKGILYTTTPTGSLYSTNLSTLVYSLLGNDNLPVFTSLAADVVFTHLAVTAAASPSTFTKGASGSYNIQVTNVTGDASTQPITVTTTLQTGITFISGSGTGWTASISGQTVTMTYTGTLAANGQLPVLTMNVAVASSASSIITTTFTVAGSDFDNSVTPGTTTVVTAAN